MEAGVGLGVSSPSQYHHLEGQQHSRWRVRIDKDGAVEAEDIGSGGGGGLDTCCFSPSPARSNRGVGDETDKQHQRYSSSPPRASTETMSTQVIQHHHPHHHHPEQYYTQSGAESYYPSPPPPPPPYHPPQHYHPDETAAAMVSILHISSQDLI